MTAASNDADTTLSLSRPHQNELGTPASRLVIALAAGAGAGARSAPTYLCGCEPPRRLRMAPTVYALADVLCGACGQPFTAD